MSGGVSPVGAGVSSDADLGSLVAANAGSGVEFPIEGDLIARHRARELEQRIWDADARRELQP